MNAITTTLTVALATVVLVGTGIAAGVVTADANPTDGIGSDETTPGNDAAADSGPPSDLPDPVPEFVDDLLGTIDEFLSGALEALGDAASAVAAGATGSA